MKQIFSILALALVTLFVACEPHNEDKGLVITSGKQYDVDANGGDVYVTYTGFDAVTTTILEGKEAIASIKTPASGIIVVNFMVNTTGNARSSVVEVTAGNGDFTTLIVFRQAAGSNIGGNTDVTFRADCLDGYYYGENYGEGSDRFAFFLSDQGLNNGGQAYPNGTYYYIDCFSPANHTTSLPLGTYTFDSSNDGSNGGKAYSITNNSQLILTTDNVETSESIKMTDATMVVSENSITLVATINGNVHKVTFVGDLTLEDINDDDSGDDNDEQGEAQSTLESDRHVTFDGEHRAKWGYEGDYWQVGYSNYTIFIMNKSNGYVIGDTLQLDIITDNQSKDGDFYGEYTCSYTPGKNVMMAGFTNNYAQSVGTWLFDYASASAYNGYAMIVDGTLKITDNGDGTSTIVLDAYDCLNNNITCNWTGVIEKD